MGYHVLDKEKRELILKICRDAASPKKIVATLVYDSHVPKKAEQKKGINILLIIGSLKMTLRHFTKPLGEGKANLLMVDRETFNKDTKDDWMGGLLAENMLLPYESLVNGEFLWNQEVKVKERMVTEILGAIILEYPEMSHEFLIKPEYFMLEAMARKASLYPPLAYRLINIFEGGQAEENRKAMMKGFMAALLPNTPKEPAR